MTFVIRVLDWRLLVAAAIFALLPLLHLLISLVLDESVEEAAKQVVGLCWLAAPIYLAVVPISGFRMFFYRPGFDDEWAVESDVMRRGVRDILPGVLALGLCVLAEEFLQATVLGDECEVFGRTVWFCR